MKLTLTILLLLFCEHLSGQISVNQSIWYLRDAHSNFTIDSVLKKNKNFTLIKNSVQSFGHDNVPYWFKVTISNRNSLPQKKIVEVDYAYLDEVMLFVTKNGLLTYKSPNVGWKYPYETRPVKHYNPIFLIDVATQSTQIVYLRIFRRTLTVVAPIKIWNEEDFFENEINRKFFWGGFGGILFFISLSCFILFIALRQRTYLYYALYVLMALIYIFMNKGLFLAYYQNGFLGIYGKSIRQLFLNLQIIFILLYIKTYLFLNFKLPFILRIIFWGCILLNLISIPLLGAEKYFGERNINLPPYANSLFPLAFLLPILFSFYLVSYNLVKKIAVLESKIYLISAIPLVFLSIFSILRNYGSIPNHWLLEIEGTMLCYLFEILVLSSGLGIRYKNLRDEKEYQQKLVYEGKLHLLHERESISRDLHDNVGSQLSVITSNLDNMGYLAGKNILTVEKIEMVNEFVREAIQSLRDTIWVTHQETISVLEFRARIQQYVLKYYSSLETCQIMVNFEETPTNLSSSQVLNLFRIIQEALNNAHKYAQASHISINFKLIKQHFIFSIIDDGIGFNVENKKNGLHFGLLNMEKRANEIEGKLNMQSEKGIGTKIEVVLLIRYLPY